MKNQIPVRNDKRVAKTLHSRRCFKMHIYSELIKVGISGRNKHKHPERGLCTQTPIWSQLTAGFPRPAAAALFNKGSSLTPLQTFLLSRLNAKTPLQHGGGYSRTSQQAERQGHRGAAVPNRERRPERIRASVWVSPGRVTPQPQSVNRVAPKRTEGARERERGARTDKGGEHRAEHSWSIKLADA